MTPLPADQAIRDRVVRDFDTTLLLEAGAGTGKGGQAEKLLGIATRWDMLNWRREHKSL